MAQAFFKFAPRVLEHLGAELISSDDVALYELVKNGFDATPAKATSATVTVAIEYYADVSEVERLKRLVQKHFPNSSKNLTFDQVWPVLDRARTPGTIPGADAIERIESSLPKSGTVRDFIRAIGRINSITVSDRGVGMDEQELKSYFLTIGTPHRFNQHRENAETGKEYGSAFIPTGEKGIGRLSMMRLGHDARIQTSKGSGTTSFLDIDWRKFSADADGEAQTIAVELQSLRTHEESKHGTTIVISDLRSPWDFQKARAVGQRFLAKFLDPFRIDQRRNVHLIWNGNVVNIPQVGRSFLSAAHNGMKAKVTILKDGTFAIENSLWFTTESGLQKPDSRTLTSLDFAELNNDDVRSVGPFEVELYHFNRRRLAAIPGVATREEFKEWLDEWSGGLKLYRDGVRVMPYGEGAGPADEGARQISRTPDDWLELDSNALRGKGFRVNRIQVVGCVRISRKNNPELRDQANREGLLDNPTAQTFTKILKELLRNFVTELDRSSKPESADLAELHANSIRAQDNFEKAIEKLIKAASDGDRSAISTAKAEVDNSVRDVRIVIDEAQKALEETQFNRIEVLELAATGVAAESFAHDLEASLDHALDETTAAARLSGRSSPVASSLDHLRSVFKTLRIQISQIKPGPARHRRRRTRFDLRALLGQIAEHYKLRLERHEIKLHFTGLGSGEFEVFAVEGHVRQIFDNLFRNSIYWLKTTRLKEHAPSWQAEIGINFDRRGRSVGFSDSGIGIAVDDAEWIFGRFHSRRPDGRGLGLFLSKELAEFNKIGMLLDTRAKNVWHRYYRFILDFEACRQGERTA